MLTEDDSRHHWAGIRLRFVSVIGRAASFGMIAAWGAGTPTLRSKPGGTLPPLRARDALTLDLPVARPAPWTPRGQLGHWMVVMRTTSDTPAEFVALPGFPALAADLDAGLR